MRVSPTFLMSVVMGGLYVGCMTPGHAGEAGRAREGQASRPASPESPFNVEMPYEGPASVDLLDDGTLVLEIGPTAIPWWPAIEEANANGSSEGPRVPWGAAEGVENSGGVYFFPLDTTGLTLVEDGNELFLDKDGAQVRARGLRARRVIQTPVADGDVVDTASQRYALLSVVGEALLDFDAEQRVLYVDLLEAEGSAPRRHVTFSIHGAVWPESQKAGVDEDTDGLIRLATGDANAAEGASCNVDGTHGSCSISCPNSQPPRCWCSSGGIPNCKCGKSARYLPAWAP